MRCIIMFGSPGSGKGTQSKLIPGAIHLSTGDILRGSATGVQYLEENPGKFAPDVMMDRIVIERLEGTYQTFILDGYPRTVSQADVLVKYLKSKDIPMTIIWLKLDAAVAMERMLKRGRPDDTPDIIKERFFDFDEKTMPVFYRLFDYANVTHTVDANRTPKEISDEIKSLLGVEQHA